MNIKSRDVQDEIEEASRDCPVLYAVLSSYRARLDLGINMTWLDAMERAVMALAEQNKVLLMMAERTEAMRSNVIAIHQGHHGVVGHLELCECTRCVDIRERAR